MDNLQPQTVSFINCKDHLMMIEYFVNESGSSTARLSRISYSNIGLRFSSYAEARLNRQYVLWILDEIEHFHKQIEEENKRPLAPSEVEFMTHFIESYDSISIALSIACEHVEHSISGK